jgi:aldehyde dehydrogenase (NAD+)
LLIEEESRGGMTSVNDPTTGAEAHMPFRGNGWRGNGARDNGVWVLDASTRWQAVNIDLAGKLLKAEIDLGADGTAEPTDASALTP